MRRMFALEARGWTEARDQALVALGCMTGFRIREGLALERRDVLTEEGFLRRSVTLRCTKTGTTRTLPLHWRTLEPARTWLAAQQLMGWAWGDAPLFPAEGSGGTKSMGRAAAWRAVRRLTARAGFPTDGIGTHSMRKTFAALAELYGIRLQRSGAQIDPTEMLRQMLGHKDIRSTMSYKPKAPENYVVAGFREVGEALAELWGSGG